jgi:hypothetical protein
MVTGSSIGFNLVRGAAAVCFSALCAASPALAAVNTENLNDASTAAGAVVRHAYLGTGLLSSAPWLVNNTPESAVFTLLGAGFIGIALLGRKRLVRR